MKLLSKIKNLWQRKKHIEVKYSIVKQGAPLIESIYFTVKEKSIVAITIYLKSKYCYISTIGYNSMTNNSRICIMPTKESLKLHEYIEPQIPTILEFTDFKDWYVFTHDTHISRSDLKICFVKHKFQ